MPRTTTLNYDAPDFATFVVTLTSTHGLGYDIALPAFEQAIGYLSTWGMHSPNYAHLHIFIMPARGEITACYSTGPEAKNTFVMCGVFNAAKRKFEFHS